MEIIRASKRLPILRSRVEALSKRTMATFEKKQVLSSPSLFREATEIVYATPNLAEKVSRSRSLVARWRARDMSLFDVENDAELHKRIRTDTAWTSFPARPPKPEIVDRVPAARTLRIPVTPYVLHSLAHVELNAVDMYLDTILRFACVHRGIVTDGVAAVANADFVPPLAQDVQYPIEFVDDILSVVDDEARHFQMVTKRLEELTAEAQSSSPPSHDSHEMPNESDDTPSSPSSSSSSFPSGAATMRDYRYGSMPAVRALWDAGLRTCSDSASRLAVIPLAQEARGLDATPKFVARMQSSRDVESARIMSQIGHEEERHVALGIKWLLFAASARGVLPKPLTQLTSSSPSIPARPASQAEYEALGAYWQSLVRPHFPDGLFPPFNRVARYAAGMPVDWYSPLCSSMAPLTYTDEVSGDIDHARAGKMLAQRLVNASANASANVSAGATSSIPPER